MKNKLIPLLLLPMLTVNTVNTCPVIKEKSMGNFTDLNTPWLTYDNDLYDKTDVYGNSKTLYVNIRPSDGSYSLGKATLSYVMLEVKNNQLSDNDYNVYQLFWRIELMPNASSYYKWYLGSIQRSVTRFAWIGIQFDQIDDYSAYTPWKNCKILQISPRTDCNKTVSYSFSNEFNLVGDIKSSSYSYSNSTEYTVDAVSVADYSSDSSGNESISTILEYHVNGTFGYSYHMNSNSQQYGNTLIALKKNKNYCLNLEMNFGFGMVLNDSSTKFFSNRHVYEYKDTYNNSNDYLIANEFITK